MPIGLRRSKYISVLTGHVLEETFKFYNYFKHTKINMKKGKNHSVCYKNEGSILEGLKADKKICVSQFLMKEQ